MHGTVTKMAACAVSVLVLSASGRQEQRVRPELTVIYVGAEDCPPCRLWRRDYFPQFERSSDFPRLSYREILSPRLFDLLDDKYWPDELRSYRDRLDQRSAVPLWFVVANGSIVMKAQGLREWTDTALPEIRSLSH